MTPDLILASNSPRRRMLLALTGLNFSLCPANIDETPLAGEHPGHYVSRLAREKAAASARSGDPGLYLGCDTTVADGMEIMGKPLDEEDAGRMLRQLRGRQHIVYTAVALVDAHSQRVEADLCVTHVPMREYSDAEIAAYVRSGDPLDKAGAYAIQSPGFSPVENFRGCYASVMGLPLCHLERSLRRLCGPSPAGRGVSPAGRGVSPADVPAACQLALDYACPVYSAVLRGEDAG